MSYIVYKHTFPNGKIYFGITIREHPNDRWLNGFGYKDNPKMFSDIVKYGWDNILHEIIKEGVDQLEAEKLEAKLIAQYSSTDQEIGYNRSSGCTSKKIYQHRAGVSKGWSVHQDHGTWCVRWRVYNTLSGEWKQRVVGLGLRVSENSKQVAELVADKLMPKIIERELDTKGEHRRAFVLERSKAISMIKAPA